MKAVEFESELSGNTIVWQPGNKKQHFLFFSYICIERKKLISHDDINYRNTRRK